MNFNSAPAFESLVTHINKGALMLQQLLTISERLVAASDQALTDLTFIRSTDQVSYCTVCLDQTHPRFTCLHFSNLERSSEFATATSTTERPDAETTDGAEHAQHEVDTSVHRIEIQQADEFP